MELEDRSVEITQIISQGDREKYKVKRRGNNKNKKFKYTLVVILI